VTTNPAQEGRPAWSPDGTKLLFTSSRDGNFEVYMMNPDLGEPGGVTQVTRTDQPVQNTMPQWSPDGKRITFASSRDAPGGPSLNDDNLEIYKMNADGSDPRRLTDSATNDPATGINEAFDERPSYSPDGTKIVFNSRRTGDAEVYTMNAADGSGLTRLTNTPGFDLRCDWAQVPPATVYPPVPVTPPVTPPRRAKHRTSLTLNARPRRDRRPPFRFTFSGRVRIPRGVSAAAVCGGRVRLVLRKGRRTVARGAARVSRGCTYRRRIAIRGTRRTGRRRARLRVTARYGGNASLSSSSRRSTTVRIF